MQRALAEADKAESLGEVPVGALVVSSKGAILGTGYNRVIAAHDPTAHAEIIALRAACQHTSNYRLEKAILVVTLEPCLMCTGAIVHARLEGVIYGAPDARAGAVDSCIDGLEQPFHNHHMWYMSGICEQECAARLHAFFQKKRRPPDPPAGF